MSDKREVRMGANPPPGKEWWEGKTVASITFVNNAEELLSWTRVDGGISDVAIDRLRARIERVKSGDEIITRIMTIQEIEDQARKEGSS
jgi:hypothetical protein